LNFGDVIEFFYNNKPRLVFVMNPEYQGLLHALDMTFVSHLDLKDVILPVMYTTDDPKMAYASTTTIKDLIDDTESYRTYTIRKMMSIQRYGYSME
jgi:hypothetical protein